MDKPKQFLKNERKLTDDSLDAERDKTNKSLSESRTNTETQINQSVSQSRIYADQALAASRSEADDKDEQRRANSTAKIYDEKKNGAERVADERERSDNAVELERSQVDAALEQEREIKNALAVKLFEQERKLTDKNLSFERLQTDTEVLRSSTLLKNEISEHSRTKISLTTRDEFLAIVSHDLRNPIGAASSCTEMLLEDPSYGELNPEVKHWLKFIKRNVDTSLRMITDLLDMERMADGKLHLNVSEHSVGKIIRQAVESLAHKAAAKSVILKAGPTKGDDTVRCDQDRVTQVLSNLIGNAIAYTPEGGSVTVDAVFSKTHVQISVKDTGIGIPIDKLSKIFERFVQLDTKNRRGLGLGLYISKMLIEAHDGQIWGESKVNEGSTLFFTIPINAENL